VQVPDQELVERVTGRRLDPDTNTIYHMKFKPPPESIVDRLIQRSDDTEDKLRNRLDTHHKNVEAVIGYYKDILVEVSCPLLYSGETHDKQEWHLKQRVATFSGACGCCATIHFRLHR